MHRNNQERLKPIEDKLVFGNVKQIEIVKERRLHLEKQEKRARKIKEGKLKKYDVTIAYNGIAHVTLSAETEGEAEELAPEYVSHEDINYGGYDVYVREMD